MARGPLAKTQLCLYWLSEFVIREHLNGSTGKVGPPIISRIVQFLSDGMLFYNSARKIMFIPFPFPHAQLSIIFVLVAIPAVAFLMDQYADNVVLGSVLGFFSVACLSGIHEVARELENPFRNIPNELPLVTFQAQFNEALLTMYSGYHPDHFWDSSKHTHHPSEPSLHKRKSGTGSRRSSKQAPSAEPSNNHGSPSSSLLHDPALGNVPVADVPSEVAATAASVVADAAETTRASSTNGKESDNNNTAQQIAKMQAKMEEYGNEIERLRQLLDLEETEKRSATKT